MSAVRTAAANAARREKYLKRQIIRAVTLLKEYAPELLSAKAKRQEYTDADR